MNNKDTNIIALGGGGFSEEPENPLLDDYILSVAGKDNPKVCFVPTASGDSDNYIVHFYNSFPVSRCRPIHLSLFKRETNDLTSFLLDQHVIYVGGGNTANMLVIWRRHGMDKALKAALEAGVVLCGVSAGAICWFEDGLTDSFNLVQLRPLHDGLGFLSGSFCPHYDGTANRRPELHKMMASHKGIAFAADNGTALHFMNNKLIKTISSRPSAKGYSVSFESGAITEEELPTDYLGAG